MGNPHKTHLLNGISGKIYGDPFKETQSFPNIHYSSLLFVDPPIFLHRFSISPSISPSLVQASKAWSSVYSLISSLSVVYVFWAFSSFCNLVFWVLIKRDIHVC